MPQTGSRPTPEAMRAVPDVRHCFEASALTVSTSAADTTVGARHDDRGDRIGCGRSCGAVRPGVSATPFPVTSRRTMRHWCVRLGGVCPCRHVNRQFAHSPPTAAYVPPTLRRADPPQTPARQSPRLPRSGCTLADLRRWHTHVRHTRTPPRAALCLTSVTEHSGSEGHVDMPRTATSSAVRHRARTVQSSKNSPRAVSW